VTWSNSGTGIITPIYSAGGLTTASTITLSPGVPFSVPFSPGSSATPALTDVSGFASYDLNLYSIASSPGSANAPIVLQVTLQWFDDTVSNIPVFEEDWWTWIDRANNAAYFSPSTAMAGSGPMHGRYLRITLQIPASCTSGAIIQFLNLFGSPRPVPYSDWRQSMQVVSPEANGITELPSTGLGFDNTLGSAFQTGLPTSQRIWIPLALYAGPVYLRFRTDASTPASNIIIASANNLNASGIGFSDTTAQNIMLSFTATATNENEFNLIAPRAPLYIGFEGNTTSETTFSFNAIGQQAA
jgi:hypothetical protein